MKSIFISFLVCSISFISFAQEPNSADLVIDEAIYKLKLEDLDMRKEIIDGKEYGCFGKKETGYLLQLRMDFPNLIDTIRNQRTLLKIREEKIILMRKMNVNLQDQSNFLMKEVASLHVELNKHDAWYRSIWFLVGMGVIIGSAGTAIIVYLIK